MKPKWLYRWQVQGFLKYARNKEFGYQPKLFIRRKSAEKFQNKLHSDHDLDMLRSVINKR